MYLHHKDTCTAGTYITAIILLGNAVAIAISAEGDQTPPSTPLVSKLSHYNRVQVFMCTCTRTWNFQKPNGIWLILHSQLIRAVWINSNLLVVDTGICMIVWIGHRNSQAGCLDSLVMIPDNLSVEFEHAKSCRLQPATHIQLELR
jgi:hypothetical protein